MREIPPEPRQPPMNRLRFASVDLPGIWQFLPAASPAARTSSNIWVLMAPGATALTCDVKWFYLLGYCLRQAHDRCLRGGIG